MTECTAVRDIGEHVRGSIHIDRLTGEVVGYGCLFCGERMKLLDGAPSASEEVEE
jgi:hypothetical protein